MKAVPNDTGIVAGSGTMPRRIPLATYRLQFNRQFTFTQALECADYLECLGISDCYASPLFRAGPQSTHGYDVCACEELNPHLGGAAGFTAWVGRLKELGLGLVLDVVPNHMSTDASNCWWWEVLERGPASFYGTWFDIDWHRAGLPWTDQVLLPVLEDHYGSVLEAGKLRLVLEDRGLLVAYHDRRFPLKPGSYATVLQPLFGQSDEPPEHELQTGWRELFEKPLSQRLDPERFAQFRDRLWTCYQTRPDFRQQVEARLSHLNGVPGQPASFDALDAILQHQNYRLSFWRSGARSINYRRFFDVTELVGLRVELPEVFQASHKLVLELLEQGLITGLRVDHPDGLWNPRQYLERLRTAAGPTYLVVEKILAGDERLPAEWPVDGTTGYDFLYRVNALFINSQNRDALDGAYHHFSGLEQNFEAVVYASKLQILQKSFPSELNALAHYLQRLASASRNGFDLTFAELRSALSQLIVAFPIYRTYATEQSSQLSVNDAQAVRLALQTAREHLLTNEDAALNFLEDLLLRGLGSLDSPNWKRVTDFVMRFQQLTGPAMAKGLEDTAFYRYNRLVSLNEVGGNPDTFGASLEDFHQYNTHKTERWPHSLLATATHDTKRGEDVRARLNVLSELPQEWSQALSHWAQLNADKKTTVEGQPAPDLNDEYLLYQTLLGAWPVEADAPEALETFQQRVLAYFAKALKEAKTHTSWTNPNAAYEAAAASFVQRVLSSPRPNPFLEDFRAFQRRVAYFGVFNSLSQLLLKLTSPGVPDFYQGTELWDLNLVDPDNRRPVDYTLRRQMLSAVRSAFAAGASQLDPYLRKLLDEAHTGEIKLFLTWQGLEFRRRHQSLFAQSQYIPLIASVEHRSHVCAFARLSTDDEIIVIAPRLVVSLTAGVERPPLGPEVWGNAMLPIPHAAPGQVYRNCLTGQMLSLQPQSSLSLSQALASFPVALLERHTGSL